MKTFQIKYFYNAEVETPLMIAYSYDLKNES